MLLYEIADDVHWLMLTNVKHIKKSVLCAQGQLCTLTNATYEQTADLSLYTWYIVYINHLYKLLFIQMNILYQIF